MTFGEANATSPELHASNGSNGSSFRMKRRISTAPPSSAQLLVATHRHNQQGCLHLLHGNYLEANRHFEVALAQHKKLMVLGSNFDGRTDEADCLQLVYDANDVPNDSISDTAFASANSNNNKKQKQNHNCLHFEDDEDLSFSTEVEFDELASNMEECNISGSSQQPKTQPQPQHENEHEHEHYRVIQMMRPCCKVQTFPYCGDQQHCLNFHHIFALPIVMTRPAWQVASHTDRSFAIIFNTAICNHLYGMQQQDEHERREQEQRHCQRMGTKGADSTRQLRPQSENDGDDLLPQPIVQSFRLAKLLYQLALETRVTNTTFVGVECYSAIFNNLSHLCRNLHGYQSVEAYNYDELLLKSIYWMMDLLQNSSIGSGSSSNDQSEHRNQASVAVPLTTAASGNGSASNSNANANTNPIYETAIDSFPDEVLNVVFEDDEPMENRGDESQSSSMSPSSYYTNMGTSRNYETMIDAFLETVFYLVSPPIRSEPASAA